MDKMKQRRPIGAAVLSFVVPGLGQLYNGEQKKAAALLAVSLIPYVIAGTLPGFLLSPQGIVGLYAGILIYTGIWIFAIGDAFIVARKLGSIRLRGFNRWYVYVGVYLLILVIPFIFDATYGRGVVPYSVPSGSMKSSVLVGDFVFVDRNAYVKEYPQRGDVIVFKKPPENRVDYMMRIVGLPGDRIQITAGVLHINGRPANREKIDPFINDERGIFTRRGDPIPQYIETLPGGKKHPIIKMFGDTGPRDNTPQFTVPREKFFVLGDNRDNSAGSRIIGYVPGRNLVGKVRIVYFSIKDRTPFWQFWKWPSEVRFDRIGHIVD